MALYTTSMCACPIVLHSTENAKLGAAIWATVNGIFARINAEGKEAANPEPEMEDNKHERVYPVEH